MKCLGKYGPQIDVKILPGGNVSAIFKTEFASSGINQTVYRVYLDVKSNISIATPFVAKTSEITSYISIAEVVIVGGVPQTYYNLEGMKPNDTTKLMSN